MQAFARLIATLDQTQRTSEKVAAMVAYFESCEAADAAWALYFLRGRRLRRLVPLKALRQWVGEVGDWPDWVFEACYEAVGDLAETIHRLLPEPIETSSIHSLVGLVEEELLPLARLPLGVRESCVKRLWRGLGGDARWVLLKFFTGGFRLGVSQALVVRALGQVAGVDSAVMAHRLLGDAPPSADWFRTLLEPESGADDAGRPYPFYLASPLASPVAGLGAFEDWLVEWKWDGIRAQLIHRRGEVMLWSRGEEWMAGQFPEVEVAGRAFPEGTVLDGELLVWDGERPAPFHRLQRRLGRNAPSDDWLREEPVVFMGYDVLEDGGEDLRSLPLSGRRQRLEQLFEAARAEWAAGRHRREIWVQPDLFAADPEDGGGQGRLSVPFFLSEPVSADSWDEIAERREESRARGTEGVMLKRRQSEYAVGRVRGDWWKWKVDPYSIDAVLIGAQLGHGRRAGLFSDYTFAVWRGDQLVPVAKAYSGLSQEELAEVDRFVQENIVARHGPVRSVEPLQVFELGFEGIQRSTRHRSGLALRFPRILRWRRDKPVAEADRIEALESLMQAPGS